jgi:hypothetical protein
LDDDPRNVRSPEVPAAGGSAPRVVLPLDLLPCDVPRASPHLSFGEASAWTVAGSKWTYTDRVDYTPPRPNPARNFRQFGAVRAHTRSASQPDVEGRVAFVAVSERSHHGFDEEIIIVCNGHVRAVKCSAAAPADGALLTDAEAQAVVDKGSEWIRETHVSAAQKRHKQQQAAAAFASSPSLRSHPSAFAAVKDERRAEEQQQQTTAVEALVVRMQAQMQTSIEKATQPLKEAGQILSKAVVALTAAASALTQQHQAHSEAQPEPAAKRTRTDAAGQTASDSLMTPATSLPAVAAASPAFSAALPSSACEASVVQLQAPLGSQALERAQLQTATLGLQLLGHHHVLTAAPVQAPASVSAPQAPAAVPASSAEQAASLKAKSKAKRRKYR